MLQTLLLTNYALFIGLDWVSKNGPMSNSESLVLVLTKKSWSWS